MGYLDSKMKNVKETLQKTMADAEAMVPPFDFKENSFYEDNLSSDSDEQACVVRALKLRAPENMFHFFNVIKSRLIQA